MLDIQVTLEGDKILLAGLQTWIEQFPKAISKALTRSGEGIYRYAHDNLNGGGGDNKKTRGDYIGFIKGARSSSGTYSTGTTVTFRAYKGAGGWPVPVRTGNLKRLLAWLKPGATKTVAAFSDLRSQKTVTLGGSLSAGTQEVIIYNAAEYANAIHEGRGSSAAYGKRPFLTDGLTRFNQGDRIRAILEEEIQSARAKAGL